MTVTPFPKTALRSYDQQQNTGRRIARLRKYMEHVRQEEQTTFSATSKRRRMVEQVAREILDNFLGSDSKNPIVQEIRLELQDETGQELFFQYPSGLGELQIAQKTNTGLQPLPHKKQAHLKQRLWEITLVKVDKTML